MEYLIKEDILANGLNTAHMVIKAIVQGKHSSDQPCCSPLPYCFCNAAWGSGIAGMAPIEGVVEPSLASSTGRSDIADLVQDCFRFRHGHFQ